MAYNQQAPPPYSGGNRKKLQCKTTGRHSPNLKWGMLPHKARQGMPRRPQGQMGYAQQPQGQMGYAPPPQGQVGYAPPPGTTTVVHQAPVVMVAGGCPNCRGWSYGRRLHMLWNLSRHFLLSDWNLMLPCNERTQMFE
uniref:Uncharacterized protein n=1 Tax=Ciona savignyi TaxID=51511 RepID=H2ZRB9_CIOSA